MYIASGQTSLPPTTQNIQRYGYAIYLSEPRNST